MFALVDKNLYKCYSKKSFGLFKKMANVDKSFLSFDVRRTFYGFSSPQSKTFKLFKIVLVIITMSHYRARIALLRQKRCREVGIESFLFFHWPILL